ncbi:alpha/beta fold hydrolase [Dictyobacter kobayashii]|uniref:AB hydrolase-1 domain-containing protein n=1 Tax=Dictyobacter kobayashii TaxID=2014872 RepID=A0A402AN89_9CHLR|nr:alpha/beta hydrolase [Dictyobacter kobayashii]GCE20586.1 hypothetical protein KDK_43860 [Dictyobacter kobayashii]
MKCIVRDVHLFYETYGTGTPIIFLHGFSSDHRQMEGCMEPLFTQQHGWQRIYLDLPGMGQTPGSSSIQGTDDILDVVVDFIDAVIPEQPFLLVGDSYGGYLSQGVTLQDHELLAYGWFSLESLQLMQDKLRLPILLGHAQELLTSLPLAADR